MSDLNTAAVYREAGPATVAALESIAAAIEKLTNDVGVQLLSDAGIAVYAQEDTPDDPTENQIIGIWRYVKAGSPEQVAFALRKSDGTWDWFNAAKAST